MAIAFDAVSPDTSSNANVSSLTSGAFTIAGTNRLLIGAMAAGAGTVAAHSAMKQGGSGGTDLTQVGTSLNVGANGRLSVWRLIAPATGSTSIYGAYAAAQDETMIGGVSYTGVDQTTPVGTPVTNTGTLSGAGGNMTVNVTTAVGDVVFAAFFVLDGNGNSPLLTPNGTPAGTGRYEIEGAQLVFEALQMMEVVATGTTTTVSCACAPTSGSLAADWGVIAFVVNAASGGGPSISGTSAASPAQGSTLTITGTAFGASQGSGSVTLGGVSQTVTSWADTSIDITVDRGVTKYGVAANLVVIDNALTSSSPFALTSIVPPSGWSYIDLTTPNPAVSNRLSSYPDLASGDQIASETVGGLVTVAADATFSAAASVSSFRFEVWTTGGWGTAATQDVFGQSFRRLSPIVVADDLPGFASLLTPANWLGIEVKVEKWVADELAVSTSNVAALQGDAAAVASASAALQLLIGLTAAAQAQASAGAALSHGVPLSATAQAAATATGAISQAVNFAAAAAGQSAASGVLSLSVPLTGAAAALATGSGAITLAVPLAGSAAGQAAASGTLATTGQVDLDGAAAGQATAAGALTLSVSLLGAAIGVAAATGALSKTDTLAGDAAGQVAASGALSIGIPLSGAAQAVASSTGALTASNGLVGAAAAVATAAGALSVSVALQGAALGQATAAGSLSLAIQLGGSAAALAAASGVVSLTVPLAGAALAVATAGGGLVVTVQLGGNALAQASASGSLSVPLQLIGAASGQASATGMLFVSSVGDFTNTAFKARAVPRKWLGRNVPRTWRARTVPRAGVST